MKAKKSVLAVVFAVAAACAFCADYTVASVTGKVQYESAPGTWKDIAKGDVLSASTVINTGLNSKLVLKCDDDTLTIKPMQKGAIEKILSSSGVVKSGAKGKLNVAQAETADDEVVKSKGISTASSRASEAKEDVEWDE